jgi:hypothetical protein
VSSFAASNPDVAAEGVKVMMNQGNNNQNQGNNSGSFTI